MTMTAADHDDNHSLGARLSVSTMPAHWLMARLGKRVLRPGGVETTRWLLERARIGEADDVVELAPGLGVTARDILSRLPRSYAGVERDRSAAKLAEKELARTKFPRARVLRGDAARVPLPDASATVVFGEAMLSMQPAVKKHAVIGEARRLLRPGGRYAIHELAVVPEDIDGPSFERIQMDLSKSIHVGVRIGTPSQWKRWLEGVGLEIEAVTIAPMRLLEPDRLLRDEGMLGTARFVLNTVTTPGAAKRLLEVRSVFRAHEQHLRAIAIVARRPA